MWLLKHTFFLSPSGDHKSRVIPPWKLSRSNYRWLLLNTGLLLRNRAKSMYKFAYCSLMLEGPSPPHLKKVQWTLGKRWKWEGAKHCVYVWSKVKMLVEVIAWITALHFWLLYFYVNYFLLFAVSVRRDCITLLQAIPR